MRGHIWSAPCLRLPERSGCWQSRYTLVILFYAFDKRFRYWHGIWHMFVVAGSVLHFIAILLFVV